MVRPPLLSARRLFLFFFAASVFRGARESCLACRRTGFGGKRGTPLADFGQDDGDNHRPRQRLASDRRTCEGVSANAPSSGQCARNSLETGSLPPRGASTTSRLCAAKKHPPLDRIVKWATWICAGVPGGAPRRGPPDRSNSRCLCPPKKSRKMKRTANVINVVAPLWPNLVDEIRSLPGRPALPGPGSGGASCCRPLPTVEPAPPTRRSWSMPMVNHHRTPAGLSPARAFRCGDEFVFAETCSDSKRGSPTHCLNVVEP